MRFRPLSDTEHSQTCVTCPSATSVKHTAADGSSLGFTFDGVHGTSTDQAQIFQEVKDLMHLVLHGQNGCIMAYGQTGTPERAIVFKQISCQRHALRNGLILVLHSKSLHACKSMPLNKHWHRELRLSSDCIAGSGKTHTMIGDVSSAQDKGLLARAVNEIAVGVAGCTDDCYFQAHTLPSCTRSRADQQYKLISTCVTLHSNQRPR